ncbi:MAG: sigma-70 family RNA polymerase sigma factor [Nitriliruptoraceae bacterium]
MRCQLGERAAFGELVERWHHPLWSFVHRMLGDPARGDDLTQEIWLRVVRGLPRLAAPDRFPAWLFTLARRVVHDELRQAYRQVDTNPLDPDEQTGQVIDSDDLDGLLDRLELETALTTLAPHDREVVALFHLADLPLSEVAEILGVPPGTVKSRLHRARRQLSTALGTEEADR